MNIVILTNNSNLVWFHSSIDTKISVTLTYIIIQERLEWSDLGTFCLKLKQVQDKNTFCILPCGKSHILSLIYLNPLRYSAPLFSKSNKTHQQHTAGYFQSDHIHHPAVVKKPITLNAPSSTAGNSPQQMAGSFVSTLKFA